MQNQIPGCWNCRFFIEKSTYAGVCTVLTHSILSNEGVICIYDSRPTKDPNTEVWVKKNFYCNQYQALN